MTMMTNDGRVIEVGSSRARVRVEPATTSGRFALIEWTLPPGAPAPPPHVHHEGSETFFVLDGEVLFPLEAGPLRARAGTCLHVPPGTVHTLRNQSNETAHVLELFCPGKLLRLVEGVGQILTGSGPRDLARLAALFEAHESRLTASEA
jgi:quercetin dioxygenase-like cupin family protein